jgi:hypothetical protein
MLGFAAPLIFLLSFISNIFFLRLLKYKMFYIYQRPTPKGTRSLGSFNYFIQFIGTFSIVVNSIVFSVTLFGFEDPDEITKYESESNYFIFIKIKN